VKLPRIVAAGLASVLLAAVSLTVVSSQSQALVVGVGDQNPALFGNELFQRLDPQRVRYIAPYDAVLDSRQRANVDAWMGAAYAAGKEIVVAFNPPVGVRCPNLGRARGCRPVSAAKYKKAFKAFHKRYPYVSIIQPWNEVNSLTQPTFHHPEAVVAYYDAVRRACRGCTVLGADIQDLPNAKGYAKALLKQFHKRGIRAPQLWGVHNYSDTNRFVSAKRSMLGRLVKILPGKIWLTETGGVYRFQPQNARQSFRPDAARQARAMEAVFSAAQRYRRDVERIYVYHWFGADPTNRWDSGVLDLAGAPRAAYAVLERHAKLFR